MIQWDRDELMKGLRELVSEMEYLVKIDDVDGKSGGICTTSEDACIFKGIPPFNHDLEYGEMLLSDNGDTNPNHKGMRVKEMYTYGIHREIYSWLEERGWYPKWYDGDTLFFWKNSGKHETDTLKDIRNHPTGDEDDIAGEILKRLNERFQSKK